MPNRTWMLTGLLLVGCVDSGSGGSGGSDGGSSACNDGSERCRCTSGGACDPPLSCISGLCVAAGDGDGSGPIGDNGDGDGDGDGNASGDGDWGRPEGDGDGDGDGGDGDIDVCQGLICSTPPPDSCASADTLRVYESTGRCVSSGDCVYDFVEGNCANGCLNDACRPDPCGSCSSPPPNLCAGDTVRQYAAQGVCSVGSCTYEHVDSVCSLGCTAGACDADPCLGVSCDIPPDPSCIGDDTLRVYANVGVCGNGACAYASTDAPCNNGCAAGACLPGGVSSIYGRCVETDSSDCGAGLICEPYPTYPLSEDRPGNCVHACSATVTCEQGSSGTATPVCSPTANCALECDNLVCPVGMICELVFGLGPYCVWPHI